MPRESTVQQTHVVAISIISVGVELDLLIVLEVPSGCNLLLLLFILLLVSIELARPKKCCNSFGLGTGLSLSSCEEGLPWLGLPLPLLGASFFRTSASRAEAQVSICSTEWPVIKTKVSRICLNAKLPCSTLLLTPDRAAMRQPVATRVGGQVMNWVSVEARAIRVSDLSRMVGARLWKTEAVWGARPRQWWDNSWLRTV